MFSLLRVAALCLFPLILSSCGGSSSSDSPEEIIPAVIQYGRLTELPESATDIKAYAWNSPFSGEWFLGFKASSEDIQSFVASSASIKELKPTLFSPERQHLLYPIPPPDNFNEQRGENEYFIPSPYAPSWYDPTIKVKGRKYEVPAESNQNSGEVIINDETNYVYIKIVWS